VPATVCRFGLDNVKQRLNLLNKRITAIIAQSAGAPVQFRLVSREGHLDFQPYQDVTTGSTTLYHGAWYPGVRLNLVEAEWNNLTPSAPIGIVTIYWED